jgi:hypothetical protein
MRYRVHAYGVVGLEVLFFHRQLMFDRVEATPHCQSGALTDVLTTSSFEGWLTSHRIGDRTLSCLSENIGRENLDHEEGLLWSSLTVSFYI